MRQEFAKWYLETQDKKGSLIIQRVAACILDESDESIRQKGEAKKIRVHKFDKMKFYELKEILQIREDKNDKRRIKDALLSMAKQNKEDDEIKIKDPKKWENIKIERYFEEVEVERQEEEEKILLNSCLDDEEYKEHQKKIEEKNKAVQNVIKSEEMKECLKNFNMTEEQLIEGMKFFHL